MKYAAETGSFAITYVPSFIQIGSRTRAHTHTHTHTHTQDGDHICLL
jgi:hypothetical protein